MRQSLWHRISSVLRCLCRSNGPAYTHAQSGICAEGGWVGIHTSVRARSNLAAPFSTLAANSVSAPANSFAGIALSSSAAWRWCHHHAHADSRRASDCTDHTLEHNSSSRQARRVRAAQRGHCILHTHTCSKRICAVPPAFECVPSYRCSDQRQAWSTFSIIARAHCTDAAITCSVRGLP